MSDDAKVIPGHGPLGDRNSLRAFAEMLRGSLAAVDAAMRAGKSLAQIKSEKVLAPWDKYAHGFFTMDQWAEAVYRELGGTVPAVAATSTQHH